MVTGPGEMHVTGASLSGDELRTALLQGEEVVREVEVRKSCTPARRPCPIRPDMRRSMKQPGGVSQPAPGGSHPLDILSFST